MRDLFGWRQGLRDALDRKLGVEPHIRLVATVIWIFILTAPSAYGVVGGPMISTTNYSAARTGTPPPAIKAFASGIENSPK